MRFLHEYLVNMPEYAAVSDTLLCSQEYGPYNPIADAGSRAKTASTPVHRMDGDTGMHAQHASTHA